MNIWVSLIFLHRLRRFLAGNLRALRGDRRWFWAFALSGCFLGLPDLSHAQILRVEDPEPGTQPDRVGIHHNALDRENWNVGFTLGGGFGISALGSKTAHDLAVGSLHLGKLLEADFSILRHVELAGELWPGSQSHPDSAYLFGLTPVLRYHLLRNSRFSPFLDVGAGVTATDVGLPDLSTTFQFNTQAGSGVHWKWTGNAGLTIQARYIHISNAGIRSPNSGANSFVFSGGLTWFF